MTLTVRMINEGNQPGDTVVIRGMKEYPKHPSSSPDVRSLKVTEDPSDIIHLNQGEEVTFTPPTDHFDNFAAVEIKGKH